MCCFFFFSSRRRHTRWTGDWSSDVCSSDLEAKEVTQQHLDDLARLAKHPKVIAWCEIGLDYYHDHSPREVQHRVFRDQMDLAQGAKLPIVIHCRDAWPDCLKLLEEVWRPTGLGGILHCFTSTLEDARRGVEMGFLVSFAGNST